jgi:dipeptidyl aminopeptidase/acylaminoacyl peptidase
VYAVAIGPNAAGDPVQVPGGSDAHAIALSADGKRLAVARYIADQNVWSFAAAGPPPRSLDAGRPVTSGSHVVETHDVSPDGRWLVYDSNLLGGGSLYRTPVAGGPVVPVVTGMTAVEDPQYSPDGREIAFAGGPDWDLWVVSAEGGAPLRLTHEPGVGEVPIWSPDGLHLAFRRPTGGVADAWTLSRRWVGGPWSEPRRLTTTGCEYQAWAPDGAGLLCARPGSDTLTLVALGGTVLARWDLTAVGLHRPGPLVFSEDGKMLYLRAQGPAGFGIWTWPWSGGRPRLVVPLGIPALPAIVFPGNLTVSRGRIYLTVSRHESDIWVMDLER